MELWFIFDAPRAFPSPLLAMSIYFVGPWCWSALYQVTSPSPNIS